jgi:hypothetical protein
MGIENPRVGGSIPSPDTTNPAVCGGWRVQYVPLRTAESGTNRYRAIAALVLALAGCSADMGELTVPSVLCVEWGVAEVLPPAPVCRRFGSSTGARFRSAGNDACEGVPCLDLGPGATAEAIAPIGEHVTWYDAEIPCDAPVPPACGSEP